MTMTLTIRDEATFNLGSDDKELTLDVPTERITVRGVIRTRVYGEGRD